MTQLKKRNLQQRCISKFVLKQIKFDQKPPLLVKKL
jgi:hypothetical protein